MSRSVKQRKAMNTRVLKHVPSCANVLYTLGVGNKKEWQDLQEARPTLQLFGCEPDDRYYQQLLGAYGGTLWNVGIANKAMMTLYLYKRPKAPEKHLQSPSCFARDDIDATGSVDIECWTLDKFDQECGCPDGIILWMDIEGMELEALQSGEQLLRSGRVKAINIEVRDKVPSPGWCTAGQIDAYLVRMNYDRRDTYNKHNTHWDAIYTPRP